MRKSRYLIAVFGVVLGFLLWTNQADAHHPEITAEADCDVNGLTTITANAEAWETDSADHRYNDNIRISYTPAINASGATGSIPVVVGSGQFLPSNNYKFTMVFTAPSNLKQIVVRATAISNWGPQQQFTGDSDFREVLVTFPLNCNDVVDTTTITTPFTTTVKETTTTTTFTPTTTIPPADTIVRQPRFTG